MWWFGFGFKRNAHVKKSVEFGLKCGSSSLRTLLNHRVWLRAALQPLRCELVPGLPFFQMLLQCGFMDTWKSGCCVLHVPIFWAFPRLSFQSVTEFLSEFMYVCIYVWVTQYNTSCSPWKKCRSTQDGAHNSSLCKNSYFLILVWMEIHLFFFPVLEIVLVWLGSGRIGMCLEQALEWEWTGGPVLHPWKPVLKHHIMLSFSQQTWMKSKIWSQKITSIKWIQVFWDKYSMGLFQNKMSDGTEVMGLPPIQ